MRASAFKQGNVFSMRGQEVSKHYDVTCIAIYKGVVQVIEPNGNIGYYRMRGIGKLNKVQILNLIGAGELDNNVLNLAELPKEYHCNFEKGAGMGRCVVNFDKSKYGL